MDEVVKYMNNKEWEKDYREKRKLYLLNIATDCEKSSKTSEVIGGILIYNQIIEQLLKEVIIVSIGFIKAKLWPNKVKFNIDFEKATFGVLIEYYKQFAIEELNKDVIILYLNDIKKIRNKIVHKIFEFKNIRNIKIESRDYYGKCYELFLLLNEYYDQICFKLYDLDEKIDFK